MIGTRLADRYEIVSELGRGGMGVVYRARDPRLNRDVAVKLIPPAQLSPEAEQRFQREAQLVAQMDHPAIVPIHDFGRHEDGLYFVMALVQGTNLRAFLRQDSLLGELIDVGIQVAEALEYSHARGVVHRDIKPENVMVTREEGFGVRVRVMDFGLARAATESRMTRTGTLLGTLGYLSPEQITGGELDGRSDIYALGTLLYECVVGEPPFSGEAQAVVYRIVHEFPQAPRSLGATIDESLEAIILACLAKEPSKRPQRAGDVAEALKRYRAGLRDSDRTRTVSELTRTLHMPRPTLAPFIGRAKEAAALQQRLNAAIAGECQFVLVGGEPGIGKTRLLDELEGLATVRQIRVLHGRSVEQDRGVPYQGFLDVILEAFRLKGTGSAPPDFSDLSADLVSLFPVLGEIPEIRSTTGPAVALDRRAPGGPESRTQIFELLARTLTRLAGGRPLVLLLEDLHAAEVSLDALDYIVRRLGPTPILIVGTYRSTEINARHPLARILEDFQGERRHASLVLGSFSPTEHRSFLETLVGAGIAESLVKKLYQGSEGNPFFTKELVRSLVDSGGIVRDQSGSWNLSVEAGLGADVLPPTIQKAVEKRIGRLPDELRDLLSIASVVGRSFDARDLAALAQVRDVDEAIDRLVEQGLIEEERESRGDLLSFSSGVVRDVLYAGLSPRKRRSLHRRCAELIETRYAGRLDRVLPQLVHHFLQGDVADKTVDYALRLARSSLEAFSIEDAMRSAAAALTFLDEEWQGPRAVEGEARVLLARALRMTGEVERALREAAAAVRIFEQEGQPARAVEALVLAAETAWQARQSEETARWVDRGLTAARAAGETEGLRQLLSLAGTLANLSGEYDKANKYVEEAAQIGEELREAERQEPVPSGGTLIVPIANPVDRIAPIDIRTVEEEEVLANVYETLVASDGHGHLVPALCASWEMRDLGRSCLVRLRSDVRFQDGHLLTAADVKASIEWSMRGASRKLPAAFEAIDGARAFVDRTTDEVRGLIVGSDVELEIRLAQPLPIYPALLSHARTAVVRVEPAIAGAPPRLVGTGPFRTAVHEADRVVLERNPGYWRGGLPKLDAIEFRPSLTPAVIAKRFRAGELHLAHDLQVDDLEEIARDARFRHGLVDTPKKNTYFALFNSVSGPIAQRAASRRALSGILRARDLVWRTLGRFAEPAVCLIPPGMLGHDPGRRAHPLTRQEAIDLLRAEGFDGPIRLTAAVHPVLLERAGALVSGLIAVWAELGVEVKTEVVDMAAFLDLWKHNAGLDLLVGRWNADYDDPDNFTHTLFHSGAGELRNYFASPESDAILEEARSENRPAVRETLYRRFETLLADAAALVPLFHDVDYRIASPKVRGLALCGAAPYVNYAELGVAESVEPAAETRRAGGGIVHVPMAGVIASLDPAKQITVESNDVLPSVFETLTRDVGGTRIVPWLVSAFSVEENGQRYRFRLRDEVTFHDGRKLGVRDVRYSLERLLQSRDSEERLLYSSIRGAKALLAGEAKDLAGFRIHSATEFSIELDEPMAFFPALLAFAAAAIIPEGTDPVAGKEPVTVGTGPFRVVAFEPGRRLELARNKHYWRKGYPRSEGLVFTCGVAPKDILSGFREGRFSIAADLFPADVDELRRETEFASGYRETPRLSTYFVAFNTQRGPFRDRALRRRLTRAVDVPRLVRQTVGRLAVPAHTLIPPGLLGHDPARIEPVQATPPDASVETIEVTAAIHHVFLGQYSALARELAQVFGTQAVKARPVTRTGEEYLDAVRRGTPDLVVGRWNADYPDPDTFAYILHSKGGFLGRLCSTPEVDRLIDRARAETTPAVRHALYRELEEIIEREALLLPLFYDQGYRIARPELEGLSVTLGFQTVRFENLRIRA